MAKYRETRKNLFKMHSCERVDHKKRLHRFHYSCRRQGNTRENQMFFKTLYISRNQDFLEKLDIFLEQHAENRTECKPGISLEIHREFPEKIISIDGNSFPNTRKNSTKKYNTHKKLKRWFSTETGNDANHRPAIRGCGISLRRARVTG